MKTWLRKVVATLIEAKKAKDELAEIWFGPRPCAHPNSYPVSSPVPNHTEYYCPDCDRYYLKEDNKES